MATVKSLQVPQIIDITSSMIRVAHPSVQGNLSTFLIAPIAAGGTTATVADNRGLTTPEPLVFGTLGDPQTEQVLINGAVTVGTSITVANTLAFAHDINCPVTRIFERSIKLYGASTDGGSLTLIGTTYGITFNQPYTEISLVTTDTAYAYYAVKFTDSVTDSTVSDYVLAAGPTYTTIQPFITQALDACNASLDGSFLTPEMMVRWANDAQLAISQFTYQDPLSGRFVRKDWSHEIIENKTSITAAQNTNSYALSSLTLPMKYPNSIRGVLDVRIGTGAPLKQISIDDYDKLMNGVANTTVATQPSVGQTTLVLADAYEFNTGGGTVYVGGDLVTYTGVTSGTTLTGIPASGTGSITEAYAVGAQVWQNITPGLPRFYTIFNGNLLFDVPIDEDYVGLKIKIRYFYDLTRLTLISDATVIPFTNVFQTFLSSKIETRQGNKDTAAQFMAEFNKQVLTNALSDMIPPSDTYTYYNYRDPTSSNTVDWSSDVPYYSTLL